MNKLLKLSFLLVFFSLCFAAVDVDAQNYGRKKKKKKKKTPKTEKTDDYFDESGNFASKLWYGGGFNLSFQGGAYYNAFNAGISPMVGYKIIGGLSAGPITGLQYYYVKGTGSDGTIRKGNAVSWSVGLFARYKFLRTLFLHTEYGIQNNEYVWLDGAGRILVHPVTLDVVTSREQQNNFYGGIGYNSGGDLLAFEMYILYNFIEPTVETIDLPITLRFGVTYKF